MRTHRQNHWYWSLIAYCMFVFVGIADNMTPSSNLRQSEERVKSPSTAVPQQPKTKQAIAAPKRHSVTGSPQQSARDAKKFEIIDVRVQGDVQFFDGLDPVHPDGESLNKELFYDFTGKQLSMNDVRDICMRYTQVMIDRGYYLAYIVPISDSVSTGTAVLEIRTATFGKNRFFDSLVKDDSGKPTTYAGKYYTAKQIAGRVDNPLAEPFNYNTLQNQIFSLNSSPDLNLDTTLRVVSNEEKTRQRVDIDYLVTEQNPFHGVLQVDNSGTKETDDWRVRGTVQHLNLTKRFDIFTADFATAFDGSVVSAAGSYFLPLTGMERASVTVFAGASDLDIDNVVTGIDTDGEGWFGGFQFRKSLCQCNDRNVDFTFDVTHRNTSDRLVQNNAPFDRDVSITPVSLGLSFSRTADDRFKGRNFATYMVSTNQRNWLWSDDDTEFQTFRTGSESEYYVGRVQIARLQKLSMRNGTWLLYFRADGQFSDEPLISSEQKAIGGMNSVRGYQEREVLGDDGFNASLELRTPLSEYNFFWNRNKSADQRKALQSVQWIVFADGGYVRRDHVLPGESLSEGMLSVGFGMRAAIADRLQIRADWGFPMEATTETNTSGNGRGHVVAQLQF